MKKALPVVALVAVVVVLGAIASRGGRGDHDPHGGRIAWVRDPAEGLAKAKAENRRAILYFTAEW